MWKEYFYFTKGERRVVVALLILIALFVVLRWALPHFRTVDERDNSVAREELQQFIHSLQSDEDSEQ